MASSEEAAKFERQRVADLTALLEVILAAAGSDLWAAQARAQDVLIRALLPRTGDTSGSWADRARQRLWDTNPQLAKIARAVDRQLTRVERDWIAAHVASGVHGDVPSRALVQQLSGAWRTGMRGLAGEAQAAISAQAVHLQNGTVTLDGAARRAAMGMIEKGAHVLRDSAGRRWQPASYAEMLLRTAAQEAHTSTVINAARELDTPYVQVSDHHRECERCRPFESRILSINGIRDEYATATLDEARAAGLFHPHCRHQIHPWWSGWDALPPPGEPDAALYRASQQQRQLERGLRAAQIRLTIERAVAPRSPSSSPARAAVTRQQAALRAHLAAYPRLKRSRRREIPRPGD